MSEKTRHSNVWKLIRKHRHVDRSTNPSFIKKQKPCTVVKHPLGVCTPIIRFILPTQEESIVEKGSRRVLFVINATTYLV